MKRVNCDEANCSICSRAEVVKGFLGIKRYRCVGYFKTHGKIRGKDCSGFYCSCPNPTPKCDQCRKGGRKK